MADATYVLALLHFNIQYCAGGLDGLIPGVDLSETTLEDRIVTESFEPVLEMLERHPTWAMDIELQGLFIEVLAARHPEVLDRLRALAKAGQVELVSFHWSDQLWTAYTARDMARSWDEVARVFDEHDLPLSPVVFTQEGQFSTGMLEAMRPWGYTTVLLPKNLAEYAWGFEPDEPLYRAGDAWVLPTRGNASADGSWAVEWSFVDDGELLATGDMNCYLGEAFVEDPEAVAAFEADLEAREAAGARIVSVSTVVDEHGGDDLPELPPVVDGTWQPDDTGNLQLWMGGAGIWGADERDNAVRTAGARAAHAAAAAEVVAGFTDTVREAWRQVLLGQVSDATGWNPYVTEVRYGLDHLASGEVLASEAVRAACEAEDAASLVVDLDAGTWWAGALHEPSSGDPVEPPVTVTLDGRAGEVSARSSELGSDVVELTVDIQPGQDPPSLVLPWDGGAVATTSALADDAIVEWDEAATAADPLGLALPTGLLRLKDGLWLVKDTASMHLAANLSRAEGTVRFLDETLPEEEGASWRLLLVQGDAGRALEVARAINVAPTVALPCPPGVLPAASGCGLPVRPAGWAALLAALGIVRRRRGGGGLPAPG